MGCIVISGNRIGDERISSTRTAQDVISALRAGAMEISSSLICPLGEWNSFYASDGLFLTVDNQRIIVKIE